MKSSATIGLLSREITLVSLDGEETKLFLHILKPLGWKNKSDLVKLKNHELVNFEISEFEIFPFQHEESFVIYFDCPLKLTQKGYKSFELTFLQ